MKRRWLAIGLLCIAPLAAAQEIVDAVGRRFPAEAAYARVVSLNPSATEILFAVGAGDRVVGVTDYCGWPEAARAKPHVGGFSGRTVSLEAVILLKPDLVVTSADMHAVVGKLLDGAGIACYALEPRSFAELFAAIRSLGALVGHRGEASTLADSLAGRLDALRAQNSGRTPQRVFWQIWPDPLLTTGGNTLISELISCAGGRNVFAELTASWPQVSLEQALLRDPEWIVTDDSPENARSVSAYAKSPGWSHLAAVRSRRVIVLDADIVNRYGPRLVDAAERLAEAIR